MHINRFELDAFATFLKDELDAECELSTTRTFQLGVFLSAKIDGQELIAYGIRASKRLRVVMDDQGMLRLINHGWLAFREIDQRASSNKNEASGGDREPSTRDGFIQAHSQEAAQSVKKFQP